MRLEYVDLATGPKQREIELPAGAVKLIPQRLYGLPSADVQEVIRDPSEPLDGEIWLRAVLMPDSAWFRRLLGDSFPIENRRLVKAFDLPADDHSRRRRIRRVQLTSQVGLPLKSDRNLQRLNRPLGLPAEFV